MPDRSRAAVSLPRVLEHVDLGSLLSEYPLGAADAAVADVRAGAAMKAVLRSAGRADARARFAALPTAAV